MCNVGDTFGSLVVVELLPSVKLPSGSKRVVKVRCDCGNEASVQVNNLRSGNTLRCKSCAIAKRNRERKTVDDSVNRFQCYKGYERGATARGFSFDLSQDEFHTIAAKNCCYCGSPPSNVFNLKHKGTSESRAGLPYVYSGIDRVDSNKGYHTDNCVPCCFICNSAKRDMPLDDFKEWLRRAYQTTIGE